MSSTRWTVIAALVGVLSLYAVSCAADAPKSPSADAEKPMVLGRESNGKRVSVTVGQRVQVRLPGNATTGYLWELARIEGAAVEAVGKGEYVPDKPPGGKPLEGSGGVSVFTFRAVKPGVATLALEYKRPWEKDQPPAEKFGLVFDVAR